MVFHSLTLPYVGPDISHLRNQGVLNFNGPDRVMELKWRGDDERSIPMHLTVERAHEGEMWLQLSDELVIDSDIRLSITIQEISIVGKENPLSGIQFFFECPSEACGRTVRKLFSLPAQRQFQCRQCMDITYRSKNRNYHKSRKDFWG